MTPAPDSDQPVDPAGSAHAQPTKGRRCYDQLEIVEKFYSSCSTPRSCPP